jgi:outer membrane protein assembly factor BamE (lipoprotein component of BamABCDE complex)
MKSKLHVVAVILVLIIVASCSTPTATPESAQIQRLNRQVEEQQKPIEELKRANASAAETNSTRQAGGEREEVSSSQSKTDCVGWKDKQNWQKIQDNMSSQQVMAILGQPTRQEKLEEYLMLFWEGSVPGSGYVSGNVHFRDNQSWQVNPPVFLNQ